MFEWVQWPDAVSFGWRPGAFDDRFNGAFFRVAKRRVDPLAEVDAYSSISD
jgi:hypothetical protein